MQEMVLQRICQKNPELLVDLFIFDPFCSHTLVLGRPLSTPITIRKGQNFEGQNPCSPFVFTPK